MLLNLLSLLNSPSLPHFALSPGYHLCHTLCHHVTTFLLVPDSKGAGGQEPAAAKAEWVKRNQKVALQKEHLGCSSEETALLLDFVQMRRGGLPNFWYLFISAFLAVQDSSIGDIVSQSVTN